MISLEKCKSLTTTSLLVDYQIHERGDGSGYYLRRVNMFLHPLAKITGMANAHVAWSSWRPHCEPNSPCRSVMKILTDVPKGTVDSSVIRAFLDCTSLFLLGSHVRLSNNVTAKVLWANRDHHARLVVVPLTTDDTEFDKELDHVRISPWIASST